MYPSLSATSSPTPPGPSTAIAMPSKAPCVVQDTPLGRYGARTVCSSCHSQVVSSVDSEYNKSGIFWALYSLLCCCWFYGLFLMCMDIFKTWKHVCPNCGNLLNEFTPKISNGKMAALAVAVAANVVVIVLLLSFGLYAILESLTGG